MRIIFIIMLLQFFNRSAIAQQWAGPDKEMCEFGSPAQIGSNDPCVDCCYIWSNANLLSCSDCKNPEVTSLPDTTVFTVEVRNKNMKLIGKDEVEVRKAFGDIRFTPDFLIQDSEDTSVAEILIVADAFDPEEIYWDFVEEDLGCALNVLPEGYKASIHPGVEYGTVTIRADYNGPNVTGECYTLSEIDVNNGVKDVWAIDPDSPNRIAKNGEILNVVDQTNVIIRAIPNPVGFIGNIPDWKPDNYGSMTPADKAVESTMSEPHGLFDNYSEYIAGDSPDFKPKTGVRRITNVQTTQLLNGIVEPFLDFFKAIVKFKTNPGDEDASPSHDCGEVISFDFAETTSNYALKSSVAESYNSPDTAYKFELSVEGAYQAMGRVYHPYFTRSFDFGVVSMCVEAYIGADAPITFAMNFVKDPAQEDDSWHVENFQGKFLVKFLGGASAEASLLNWDANVALELSASVESIFEFQAVTGDLVAYVELKPASGTFTASITKTEDDMQSYSLDFPSKEVQIMDPIKSSPFLIYSFY